MYRNKPNRLLFHFISRCSKLIVIKLCAISKMHAKVRRESVAGYATDETLVCGPKEHTRWWQRCRGHLQGLLYRLILNSYLSRCSKLIAIKLCAISEMHDKVRRESVAGYATDETLVCGPKEHTRWWQRYRGHLQGLLYRLILKSYLSRCSKLIAIKLFAISEMHAKVRRESVAGYATDETLVCGQKEHTR